MSLHVPLPAAVARTTGVESLKAGGRTALEALGLGQAYFRRWWQRNGSAKSLLTDWNRAHGAVFVHVPKTAGMSIERMLQMQRPSDYHAPACAYRAADPDFWARSLTFTVIRDPWDRLVSAYHYGRWSSPFAHDHLWAAQHLEGFETFEAFVLALQRPAFRARAFQRLIFMPQSYFVCDLAGRREVKELAPFDSLDAAISSIAGRLGLPPRQSRVNSSDHEPSAGYYTPQTRAVVARVYKRDVALYEEALRHGVGAGVCP